MLSLGSMSLLLSSLSVNRCTILFFIVNSKFSRINNEPPVSHCLVICLTSVPLLSLTLTVCGSLKLPNPLMYSTFLKNKCIRWVHNSKGNKLRISLFLTTYQLEYQKFYRYLYLQLVIKHNLVFTNSFVLKLRNM